MPKVCSLLNYGNTSAGPVWKMNAILVTLKYCNSYQFLIFVVQQKWKLIDRNSNNGM